MIFNSFTQGSKEVTKEFGGLGLGLAISQATVDAHNGTLRAKSRGQNKGATFIVELPLQSEAKEQFRPPGCRDYVSMVAAGADTGATNKTATTPLPYEYSRRST
jgi:hypothetical protein